MSSLVCYPNYRLGVAFNINTVLDDFMALANAEPAITRAFVETLVAKKATSNDALSALVGTTPLKPPKA